MPFYVYILSCADGSYYTGHTDELALMRGDFAALPGLARNRQRRIADPSTGSG